MEDPPLGVPPKIGVAEEAGFVSPPNRGDVPFVLGVPNIDELFGLLAPKVLAPPNIDETLLSSCFGGSVYFSWEALML